MLTGSIRNLLRGFILLFILQRLHPLPVKNDFIITTLFQMETLFTCHLTQTLN